MTVLSSYCRRFMEMGMNWVLYGADIALLVAGMRRDLGELRSAMGDTYQPGANPESGTSCLEEKK